MIQRWHILGAGAMGRLFACKLLRLGLEPVLLMRAGSSRRETLALRFDGREEAYHCDAIGLPELQASSIEGLLVTTKANHALAAVQSCRAAITPGAPVILLHNGMGVLEALAGSGLHLLAGTTTEGAYLDATTLVHAGLGETVIGREGDSAPQWLKPFSESAERISWTSEIDNALWKKLLINCAINPLTALHRCRNGTLVDNPVLRAEMELLCEELAAVSAARGNARGASCALDWALSVVQRTAANQSSMLQDVLQGRETEIRYITGYLVAEAKRLGVPCPRNEALLRQLDSAAASH